MADILEFKKKQEEIPVRKGELMFELSVYDEGAGRGFEISVDEDVTDTEVFSCLMAIASEYAPEDFFDEE